MAKIKSKAFFLIKQTVADKAFELRELLLDSPNNDQVHVKVEAFGLNYADVMARKGLYKEAPPLPAVIGYEVVGTIISSPGEKALEGKRVLAFTRFGGYAQDVITFRDSIIEIGDKPCNECLALGTQGGTAFFMTNIACQVFKDEYALVHAAAGGVGSLLVQILKEKGAKVIAKVSSQEKEMLVKNLGADFTINYLDKNYSEEIKKILGSKKLDLVFNAVGGKTFKEDSKLLAFGGRLVLFGGAEVKGKSIFSQLNFVRKMGFVIPVFKMMKSQSIIGVNMLKIADYKPEMLKRSLHGIFEMYENGKLKILDGGIFNSEDLHKAHALLESGKSTGKISVKW